jgi:hypothetical protein
MIEGVSVRQEFFFGLIGRERGKSKIIIRSRLGLQLAYGKNFRRFFHRNNSRSLLSYISKFNGRLSVVNDVSGEMILFDNNLLANLG